MKNKTTIVVVVLILIGASFYGGVVYGKRTLPTRGQFTNSQFTGNVSGARGTGMRGNINGGFTAGEIISKDATSITIKMQDGSTKIVLVATSTQVMKSSAGSLGDLTTGTNVTITGTANSDGSLTAQNVQIRPAGLAPIGGMRATR
ncbi:MAG: hypothetical protein WCW47_02035 [Candidatus Paceibacterota bacterium]|jgi:hypothetical protein